MSYLIIGALKAKIAVKWEAMDEDYIWQICGSFRRRVQGVIDADGV